MVDSRLIDPLSSVEIKSSVQAPEDDDLTMLQLLVMWENLKGDAFAPKRVMLQ
jgi:hypothetical protein